MANSTLTDWNKKGFALTDKGLEKLKNKLDKHPVKLPNLLEQKNGGKIFIKPLSVNQAWQGKRYKSKKYIAYSEALTYLLPNDIVIPDGLLAIHFEYGLSSMGGDWDNPVKPSQDLIAKKYDINDNRIRRGVVDLVLVKKGQEYIKFKIEKL